MLKISSAPIRESDLPLDRGEKGIPPTQSSISIRRVVRAMRGGSQSQLVQGDDGHFYVCKFLGNPQGSRTVINEVLSQHFMKQFDVSIPENRLLELSPSAENVENVYFLMGSRRVLPQPGLHFGSRCPVNPERTAIFDFMPVRMLSKISNVKDFATMFVLDKWLNNTDARQAIYIRDRNVKGSVRFRAYFVDHGFTFGGRHWRLDGQSPHGLAFPRSVYSLIDMRTLTKAAVDCVEEISGETLQSAVDGIPGSWLAPGDHSCLARLLLTLESRRRGLRTSISRHLDALSL